MEEEKDDDTLYHREPTQGTRLSTPRQAKRCYALINSGNEADEPDTEWETDPNEMNDTQYSNYFMDEVVPNMFPMYAKGEQVRSKMNADQKKEIMKLQTAQRKKVILFVEKELQTLKTAERMKRQVVSRA